MRFMFGVCFGAALLLLFAARTEVVGFFERESPRVAPVVAEQAPLQQDQVSAPSKTASDAGSTASIPEPASIEAVASESATAEDVVWPAETALPEAFAEDYAWWAPEEDLAGVGNGEVVDAARIADPLDSEMPDAAAAAEALPENVGGTELPVREALVSEVPLSEVPVSEVPESEVPESEVPVAATPTAGNPVAEAAESGPQAPNDVDAIESIPVVQPVLGGIATRPEQASVWTPFHSEMSANGFAQRLARALEHPFEVRRDGPGRYQVVFPYESDAARDELLARVAMLTGTQP